MRKLRLSLVNHPFISVIIIHDFFLVLSINIVNLLKILISDIFFLKRALDNQLWTKEV